MKTYIHTLEGLALGWAVALIEGKDNLLKFTVFYLPIESENTEVLQYVCRADDVEDATRQCLKDYNHATVLRVEAMPRYSPNTVWEQGGPIIDREKINLSVGHDGVWMACIKQNYSDEPLHLSPGHTALTAAMRCYVASYFNATIEIPEGLK
jgi:hypothetical protein